MDTVSLVFLGAIALFSVLQGVFLLLLAREGLRAVGRVEDLAGRLARELRPAVQEFTRTARNLAAVSDLAAVQARRLDALVAEAVQKVERTQGLLQEVILPSAGRVAAVAAAVRLVKGGLRLYRRLRG